MNHLKTSFMAHAFKSCFATLASRQSKLGRVAGFAAALLLFGQGLPALAQPFPQTILPNSPQTQSTYVGANVWLYAYGSNSGYVWSSGSSSSNYYSSSDVQSWSAPGTYTVTVQAGVDPFGYWGSSNVLTFTVIVLPPQAQTLTANSSLTQTTYAGYPVWFYVQDNSQTGYAWSAGVTTSGDGSSAYQVWNTPGTYSVTVQEPSEPPFWGASNTLSFSVTVLPPQAQTITTYSHLSQFLPQGQWAVLDAEGGNTGLNWTSSGGTMVSSSNAANETTWAFPAPGRYTVTAQAPASAGYGTWAPSNTITFNISVLPANAPEATMGNKDMLSRTDPVEMASGSMVSKRELFAFSGARNWDFTIGYNSIVASNQTAPGVLGYGWSHPFEATIVASGANLVVNWDSTHNNTFEPVSGSSSKFHSAEVNAMYDTLVVNPSGGWLLTRQDQSQLVFAANGTLTQDVDAHGRVLNLAYDSSGRLSTITEPISGTALTFAYNGSNSLTSLTDATGATVTFSYSGTPTLASIVNQDGKSTSYTYDSKKNLLTIVNNEGVALISNTYNSLGQAVSQADSIAGHSPFQAAYSQASSSSNIATKATDRMGAVTTYTFDPNFNLLSQVDPLGRATSYVYDFYDNLLSETDPLGNTTSFTYDSNGNLITATDAAGKVTTYTYDAQNHLLTVSDPLGDVTTRTYDTNGNLLTLTDAAGNKTTWTYNSGSLPITKTLPLGGVYNYAYTAGHLTQITDPNGVTVQFTYDGNGRLLTRQDSAGNTTKFSYDGVGNLTTVTNPSGGISSYSYDSRNRLQTKTDPAGAVTTYSYDNNGNLLTAADPLGKVTTNTFDPEDRISTVTDPLGHKVTVVYDNDGEATSVTDATGAVTQFGYDADGNRTTSTDALGNQSVAAFDTRNRLTQMTDPLNRSTVYGYDDLGRRVTDKDPLGLITALVYDPVGHLTGLMDPGSIVTSQSFDANGNQTGLTNGSNNTTTFTRDSGGRVTAQITPAAHQTTYTYNSIGLLVTKTRPSGNATQLTYDAQDRVATVADGVGTDTITRDADGRQLTVVENGHTLARVYDLLGRLTQYTDLAGNVIKYRYDAAGNLSTLTYPDGKVVTYSYDAANRLKTVTDWANRGTTYTYDLDGRLTATARPNGTSQTRTYDAAGQISALTEFAVDGATVIYSTNPTYDADGRITGETLAPAVPVAVPGQTTMTYDVDNQLTTLNSLATTFDADGNLLTLPGGTPSSYTYDARNRLTAAGGLTYAYDAEGNRVGVTSSAGTTAYVVNPNVTLSQVLVATGPDGTVTRYVYGLGLAYEEATPPGGGSVVAKFYHFNRRGDTVALTDNNGNVTDTVAYAAFGATLSRTGTSNTPFLFNGLYGVMSDPNGLTYHRARYYNPAIRRWLNTDPTGFAGGINLYAYVANNPLSSIDPSGLSGTLTIYSSGTSGLGNHSWISYSSDTTGATTTYGTWGNNPTGSGNGLFTNLESGRGADATRSEHLDDTQEATLLATVDAYKKMGASAWTYGDPCSSFAATAWNASTGEHLSPYRGPVSNPTSLTYSIIGANGGAAYATVQAPAQGNSSGGSNNSSWGSSANSSITPLGNLLHSIGLF